ncbi:hypothetical protein NUW54_g8912 [Trametes sanguinea]|uniref:Uncharacterized protein n=1 Tax=Trametes sanguinea TaxID=158606 RepID=A0ACC1PBF6_9APHY|nr:hypothetical protein NUW54_g8912 [Trametes sanguinea]
MHDDAVEDMANAFPSSSQPQQGSLRGHNLSTDLQAALHNQALDRASSTGVATLQERLSRRAMDQITRIQRMTTADLNHALQWEAQFAEALEELDAIEGVTASLLRTVIQLRWHQASYDTRMVQLEDEIKRVDVRLEDVMEPFKASYRNAEATLRKSTEAMKRYQTHCAERIDALQSSFKKTQCDLTVLQSQWGLYKDKLDELQDHLAPTEQKTEALSHQCAELERKEEALRTALQRVEEELADLESHAVFDVDQSSSPSLEDEMQAALVSQDEMQATLMSHPAPTRDSEGWWDLPGSRGSSPSVSTVSAWNAPAFG